MSYSVDRDTDEGGLSIYKAFCNDCSWSADSWEHTSDYLDRGTEYMDDLDTIDWADDLAFGYADELGEEHTCTTHSNGLDNA